MGTIFFIKKIASEVHSRELQEAMKKIVSLLITVMVLLLIPLPFAMVLSGVNFLTGGWSGASQEFWVSYAFGLVTLLVSLGWYLWKVRARDSP